MSVLRYPVPVDRLRCEIIIERSRFLTTIFPITSPEQMSAKVAVIREEFPGANHNCWAYLVGPPGSTDRIGLSDDGEPHGTAGRPMLVALQHSGIGDIVAVVTRFFGGVKLGTGGLVKAYTRAVAETLALLEVREQVPRSALYLRFAYPLLSAVERLIPEFEGEITGRTFAETVALKLTIPVDRIDQAVEMLVQAGSGTIEISRKEE